MSRLRPTEIDRCDDRSRIPAVASHGSGGGGGNNGRNVAISTPKPHHPTTTSGPFFLYRNVEAGPSRCGRSTSNRSTTGRDLNHRSNADVVDSLPSTSSTDRPCFQVDDVRNKETRNKSLSLSAMRKKRSNLVHAKLRSGGISKKQRLDGHGVDRFSTAAARHSQRNDRQSSDEDTEPLPQTSGNERIIPEDALPRSSTDEDIVELEDSFTKMQEMLNNASKKVDRICKSRDSAKKMAAKDDKCMTLKACGVSGARSRASTATDATSRSTSQHKQRSMPLTRSESPYLSDSVVYDTESEDDVQLAVRNMGRRPADREPVGDVTMSDDGPSTSRSNRVSRNLEVVGGPDGVSEDEAKGRFAVAQSRRFARLFESSDSDCSQNDGHRRTSTRENVSGIPKNSIKKLNPRRIVRFPTSSSSDGDDDTEPNYRNRARLGTRHRANRSQPMQTNHSDNNPETFLGVISNESSSGLEADTDERRTRLNNMNTRRRIHFSPRLERYSIRPSRTDSSFRSPQHLSSRSLSNLNRFTRNISSSESDEKMFRHPVYPRRERHSRYRPRFTHGFSPSSLYGNIFDTSSSDSEIEVLDSFPSSISNVNRSSSLDRHSSHVRSSPSRHSSPPSPFVRRARSSDVYVPEARREITDTAREVHRESSPSAFSAAGVLNNVPEDYIQADQLYEMEQIREDERYARMLQAEFDSEYAQAASVIPEEQAAAAPPVQTLPVAAAAPPVQTLPVAPTASVTHSVTQSVLPDRTQRRAPHVEIPVIRSARYQRLATTSPHRVQLVGEMHTGAVRRRPNVAEPRDPMSFLRMFAISNDDSSRLLTDSLSSIFGVDASDGTTLRRQRMARHNIAVEDPRIAGIEQFVEGIAQMGSRAGIRRPAAPVDVPRQWPSSRARVARSFRQARATAGLAAPTGDHDYEALLLLDDLVGNVPRGLTQHEISHLPKCKANCRPGGSGTSNETPKECLICISDYVDGESQRILPCFHYFHTPCIDAWLRTSNTCPVCRHVVKVDLADASPY